MVARVVRTTGSSRSVLGGIGGGPAGLPRAAEVRPRP